MIHDWYQVSLLVRIDKKAEFLGCAEISFKVQEPGAGAGTPHGCGKAPMEVDWNRCGRHWCSALTIMHVGLVGLWYFWP